MRLLPASLGGRPRRRRPDKEEEVPAKQEEESSRISRADHRFQRVLQSRPQEHAAYNMPPITKKREIQLQWFLDKSRARGSLSV
eukprot:4142058-Lingulodinium_polyedra.AAC.1